MIKIVGRGEYSKTKVLDGKIIISIVNTDKPAKKTIYTLNSPSNSEIFPAFGKYRIYQVEDEVKLLNGSHIELLLARGRWQGYLLSKDDLLVPTNELITRCSCNGDCASEYPLERFH